MRTSHAFSQHRAFCSALRTLRSAAVALGLVWLPALTQFIQRGTWSRAEFFALLQSLAVAALIVTGNFLQRLREKDGARASSERAPRTHGGR